MDERLTPDELSELLGAFALGAVGPGEREQVEAFVLDDRDARSELHRLEHAVAWLGHASPRPSEASWDAVQREIAADLEADRLVENTLKPTVDAAGVAAAPVTAAGAPVADLADHRSRRSWRQIVAVAAATIVLLGTAIGVANVILKDSKTPPGRSVALRSPDGGIPIRITLHRNGSGLVRSSDLPPALSGHVYQLWYQSSATAPMHSAGLLGRSPKGHQLRVPEGSFRIAVSVEPVGGSTEPTTDPVAVSGTL